MKRTQQRMALKLLAVGDIHLGRRPSRLPEALAERARELGPAGAWERAVATAIRLEVDAVLLAGDVIERQDDFYEGYRELHAGVTRLAEAGIRVLGVAGNHDVHVLPRLARQLPDFHLVGADGDWEAVDLGTDAEPLTLWGWSFPRERVPNSPLAGATFERRPGMNLGLLHCDRDQPGSPYAPVSSAELRGAGLDGWLLGHIHAPNRLSVDGLSGYLGSLTGMDPGEPGAHGPWLLTVEHGRLTGVEQQVLAPLRWTPVELDVTGIESPEAVHDRMLERLREIDAELAETAMPPTAVGLRLNLVGRSAFGGELPGQFGDAEREHVFTGARGSHYFLERVRSQTRPEIPLADLAERSDPPGLLARRLLLLERPADDPDRQALLAAARRRMEPLAQEGRWQPLGPDAPDEAAVADRLRRAGSQLLERLLAQQEDAA